MMEAGIRCGVEERLLAVVGGAFGERFARIAESCDREVVRLHVPRGEALDPATLREMLDGPPVDAVSLVHVETSTGAVAPIADLIAELRQAWDPIIIVDAVGSFGGMPVLPARWDADFVVAASHKALALPPGLAFGMASRRYLARAKGLEGRGFYLDALMLHEAAKSGVFPQTPALPVAHALEAQLERIDAEGLAVRWRRHTEMREVMERWVATRTDVDLLAPPRFRADTVSTLVLADRSARKVIADLAAARWQVGSGLGDEHDREVRIGHMGDASPDQLDQLLKAIEEVL
jgi:aspartate aminotransferase-like enzyme